MRCTELSSPRTQWPQDTTDSDFTEGRFASINSSECIHTRYDQDGNVTSKTNVLNSAYSEAYTYDQLNRLASTTRNGSAYQSWNLDSQGNWSGYTNQGSTQTETANGQNQITSISGRTTPTYDANGNMIGDQNGNTLIYDGRRGDSSARRGGPSTWNRLVEVKNSSGAIIAQYSYNAQNYAVTVTYPQGNSQIPADTSNYIYYSNQWQVIEVRTGGTSVSDVSTQIVWSAAYVNAAILQDSYANGVIQPNERLYLLQDADWNTTAVVGYNSTTQTWGVVQRFVYDSYGNVTVLSADWSAAPAGTQPMVNALYQGMRYDPITGLYYGRARWYSASLGRWISQDPLSYINGASMYQFVGDGPVVRVDPLGLYDYTGPSKPVWGTGVWSGKCPAVTETQTASFDLGIVVLPLGVTPNDSTVNKVLRAVLEGLDKFSVLGAAITDLAKQVSAYDLTGQEWRGHAVLTKTATYKCNCKGQLEPSPVVRITSSLPTWSDEGLPTVLLTEHNWVDEYVEWKDLLQNIVDQFK